MTQGERLRAARMKHGLTQKEVARMISVNPSRLGEWERDEKKIPDKRLRQISEVLYVKESWLRGGGPEREAPPAGADKTGHTVSLKYCDGCFHFGYVGSNAHCDYIGNTGHRRPCPAGEGCTERITPARWREQCKQMKIEFNGYYQELRREKDAER